MIFCGLTSVLAAAIFVIQFTLGEASFLRGFMNAMVMVWVAVLGYVDLKEKIIPNPMILLGLGFWLLISILEITIGQTHWKSLLAFSLTGGFICGGILLVVSLAGKSALGMGDVKMITVLGLLYGLVDTYSLLLVSLVVMALVSITLLLLKKVDKKTAIPMAPFIVIGYILSIFAGM